MKFGHFDDSKREYVITNPRTPYPWLNYLGCEDFFSLITNTAGGKCGRLAGSRSTIYGSHLQGGQYEPGEGGAGLTINL